MYDMIRDLRVSQLGNLMIIPTVRNTDMYHGDCQSQINVFSAEKCCFDSVVMAVRL
jgi:hypothetical protein